MDTRRMQAVVMTIGLVTGLTALAGVHLLPTHIGRPAKANPGQSVATFPP